jgi:hypothetical protein
MALKVVFYRRAQKELQGLPKAIATDFLSDCTPMRWIRTILITRSSLWSGKNRPAGCVWGIGVYYSTVLAIR